LAHVRGFTLRCKKEKITHEGGTAEFEKRRKEVRTSKKQKPGCMQSSGKPGITTQR
jgi:hypothetical protein